MAPRQDCLPATLLTRQMFVPKPLKRKCVTHTVRLHVAWNTWTVWPVHFVDMVAGKLVNLIANVIYAKALCCAVAINYHPRVGIFRHPVTCYRQAKKGQSLDVRGSASNVSADQNFRRYTEQITRQDERKFILILKWVLHLRLILCSVYASKNFGVKLSPHSVRQNDRNS